jgi:hypothetical protein
MILILHKKMGIVFTESRCLADQGIVFQKFGRHPQPVFEFPWRHIGSWVIFDMPYVAAAFQHEGG